MAIPAYSGTRIKSFFDVHDKTMTYCSSNQPPCNFSGDIECPGCYYYFCKHHFYWHRFECLPSVTRYPEEWDEDTDEDEYEDFNDFPF